MNVRFNLPGLFAAALAVLLLSGCATPPADKAAAKKEAYIDSASGVVLPGDLGSMNRLSVDGDDTPVVAHYSSAPTSLYIDAGVRIMAAGQVEPDQLLGQTIRSVETQPNFALGDYRGSRTFGAANAFCAECSFDRGGASDRVTFKIVIVPRGNYLLCFTFLVRPVQEQEAQGVIDGFVQGILDASNKKKPVYMTPNTKSGDGGEEGDN